MQHFIPAKSIRRLWKWGVLVELKVFDRTDRELTVEIRGEGDTLLNFLQDALLRDKRVLEAVYNIRFPYSSDPLLYLKTDGSDPVKVLLDTCNSLLDELSDFRSSFNKSFVTK